MGHRPYCLRFFLVSRQRDPGHYERLGRCPQSREHGPGCLCPRGVACTSRCRAASIANPEAPAIDSPHFPPRAGLSACDCHGLHAGVLDPDGRELLRRHLGGVPFIPFSPLALSPGVGCDGNELLRSKGLRPSGAQSRCETPYPSSR
jgi:hypothetical protein